MIVSTPREKLWAFINTRLDIPWSEDFRAVGNVINDCLLGVFAYNSFTGRTCFLHSAIDNPIAVDRTFLRAAFEYPFIQCNLTYVIAPVLSDNLKSMDRVPRLGFKEQTRLKGAGLTGSDLVMWVMHRSECKWIKHGKELSTTGP